MLLRAKTLYSSNIFQPNFLSCRQILVLFAFALFVYHFSSSYSVNFLEDEPENQVEIIHAANYNDEYCVIYNYWKAADEYSRGDHITLALHSTIQYMPYLEEHLYTWTGAISVALFISTPGVWNETNNLVNISESQLIDKATFSSLSSPLGKQMQHSGKVSLHLYFEKKENTICPMFEIPKDMYDIHGIDFGDTFTFGDITTLYPINIGRNIARIPVETQLFISGDMEQFFVPNFEQKMLKLGKQILIRDERKTVLVHRRFEIDENVGFPQNKKDLSVLLSNKTAFPFHYNYYYVGHEIPNVDKWLEIPENPDTATVFEEIQYQSTEWETQFVGDSRVPYHDERFPYRYRNNAALNYHLCFLNFTYSIVNDLYTIHRGVKRGDSLKIKHVKELVKIPENFALRRKHRRELADAYPEMAEKCFVPSNNTDTSTII